MRYDTNVRAAVLLAGWSLGCAQPARPPPPSVPAAAAAPERERVITPRERLPSPIQPLLPQRGIYAAGGGLVSSAWRIVVDRDAKTIYWGTAEGANAPSFGKMDREGEKPLSPRNERHFAELAEAAWREGAAPDRSHATADYDEVLIVVDGSDAYFLQGHGPIKQPAAAKVIEELRAAAGL